METPSRILEYGRREEHYFFNVGIIYTKTRWKPRKFNKNARATITGARER